MIQRQPAALGPNGYSSRQFEIYSRHVGGTSASSALQEEEDEVEEDEWVPLVVGTEIKESAIY